MGHNAVQPGFTGGHDGGIFSWDYLYKLGSEQAALWAQYEQRLQDAGKSRDTRSSAPPAKRPAGGQRGKPPGDAVAPPPPALRTTP